MAPPAGDIDASKSEHLPIHTKDAVKSTPSTLPTPLKYSGSLDDYDHFDVTSVIGREFPKLQLSQIIDDDAKIRDLAITGKAHSLQCEEFSQQLTKLQSHNAGSCSSGIKI